MERCMECGEYNESHKNKYCTKCIKKITQKAREDGKVRDWCLSGGCTERRGRKCAISPRTLGGAPKYDEDAD